MSQRSQGFFKTMLGRLFGSDNTAMLRKLWPVVDRVNELDGQFQRLSPEQLRAKTDEFRKRIDGYRNELFATVRTLQAERDALDEDEMARRADEFHETLHAEYQRIAQTIPRIRKNRRLMRLSEIDDRVVERIAVEGLLWDILPEAFAVVKASCRNLCGQSWEVCGQETTWKMVPFDVQVIGGICMHLGNISEMLTGEGKTLAATMPSYLNALAGHVHVVTFNDYLARRDAQWNGPVLESLGITVGAIQSHEHDPQERKRAYACDVTYGTASEFGFDYLRDNMKPQADLQVQGPLDFAIVDEVDSILVDEARTPLIISGPTSGGTHHYDRLKGMVQRIVQAQKRVVNQHVDEARRLLEAGDLDAAAEQLWIAQEGDPKNDRIMELMQQQGVGKALSRANGRIKSEQRHHEMRNNLYYFMEEGRRSVNFTDKAQDEYPELQEMKPPEEEDLGRLPETEQEQAAALESERKLRDWSEMMHNVSQLIVAYTFYQKDVDYVVMEDKVVIVDEFTGRLMPGRQWSDGLHQAVEAKEGVKIREETQTLATITLQNFFRLYKKLSGMTGTAMTEAAEFAKIYGLGVVAIPTNKPMVRDDRPDKVYPTAKAKYKAVVGEIEEVHGQGRPVLVGTVAVEKSEYISEMLGRRGIRHEVLNAKNHEREAAIVAKAGQPGNVVIATNMAGRGTDIVLGEGVADAGGLHVIGTERHEARRIDNQLRGRSGRQGDPGSSQFFLSLEDDLMRVFAGDWVRSFLARMGFTGDEMIDSPLVTRQIGKAQKKVEERNFGIRENLLKYDTVMDEQRWDIYSFRQSILDGQGQRHLVMDMFTAVIEARIAEAVPDEDGSDAHIDRLCADLYRRYGIRVPPADLKDKEPSAWLPAIMQRLEQQYAQREKFFGDAQMREIERYIMLECIDQRWKDHLYAMDALRDAVGLVGYGQQDPYLEYSKGAHEQYSEMTHGIREDVAGLLLRVSVAREEAHSDIWSISDTSGGDLGFGQFDAERDAAIAGSGRSEEKPQPFVKTQPKVGRNAPCPCGSGKKYKHCCARKG